MRVLVTGGAGFIGSHLTDALLAAGHAVHVVDDLSTGHRDQVPAGAALAVQAVGEAATAELVRRLRPEVIFHLAAQVSVRRSVEDPGDDADRNVVATARLAHAAAAAGARAIIFSSSGGAIYGEQEVFPAGESHPLRPASPYGAAKLAGEAYLDVYARLANLRVVHLRYANVYGPRQDPHGEAGVVAIFTRRLLLGEAPRINGDGRQTRDYVFVGDVVRANLLALARDACRGPYNIGTGVETDVVALAQHLIAATGAEVEPVFGPAQAGEQRRSVLDAGRAGRELGWQPEVRLADGLARTVAAMRQGSRP